MPNLEYLTTCQVSGPAGPCNQRIKANAIEVPLIGEPPSMRAQRLVGGFYKHLEKCHPEMAAQVAIASMMLQGFMILRCFDTPDPNLITARDNARGELAKLTRQNLLPDSGILDSLAKIGCDQAQIDLIAPVIRQMRDFLQETGPYSPESMRAQASTPVNGHSTIVTS